MDDLTLLENELKRVYSQAAAEMSAKVTNFYAKFAVLDSIKQQMVKDGKITRKEYLEWRKNKMAMGRTYQSMVDVLSRDMTNTNQIANSIINGYIPEAYAFGINHETYQIETGIRMNTSFTLYNRQAVERIIRNKPDLIPWTPKLDVPKDLRWNKQHINNAITQGILQGESIPNVAKRLQGVAQMNNRQAIRTARTAMTSAENAGRNDGFKRAQSMGIEMHKQWISTLDHRTRDSHVRLDGEIVAIGSKFSNGLEYPGGAGDPAEVYNCRCAMRSILDGIDMGKADDMGLRNDRHLEGMSYDEWKQSRSPKPTETSSVIGNTGQGYTKQQVAELSKLVENTNPLVRDTWNKYLPQLEKALPPEKGRSGYYYPGETVHFNTDRVANGDVIHTPYQTHFHEYAHNIDWLIHHDKDNDFVGVWSHVWRDVDGRSFDQIISDEWYNKFTNKMSDLDIAKHLIANQTKEGGLGIHDFVKSEIRQWRLNSGLKRSDEEYVKIKNEFDNLTSDHSKINFFLKHFEEFGSVTEFDRQYYNELDNNKIRDWITDIKDKYSRRDRSDLSDMMEKFAVSTIHEEYPLGAGHGKDYWKTDFATAHEAFAEIFSAEIANPGSLELIKQEMPETYDAFRRMLEEALQQ